MGKNHNHTIYLPGLNAIRALAALMVVITHINQNALLLNIENFNIEGLGLGWKGVVLFFTLSGFLITYLLLLEKNKFRLVDFKKFYIRRILRIWPIYYLILSITLLLIYLMKDNQVLFIHNKSTILHYSFFLANYEYIFGASCFTLTPLWSVAVEEQFYIMWPWLMQYSKSILKGVFVFLCAYFILKISFRYFDNNRWYLLVWVTSFSCMAIGALGVAIYCKYVRVFEKISANKVLQYFVVLIFVIFNFSSMIKLPTLFERESYAFVDLLLIMNLSLNKHFLLQLEHKIFQFLGVISYGVYVYHMLIIYFVYKFFTPLKNYLNNNLFTFIVYSLVLGLTLFLANTSYKYFELYFINLKTKFSKVHSTNLKR